jgi:hypothetical protein
VPDPKAPMVPPYSIDYFNNNAAGIPQDTTKVAEIPGIPVFKPKISLGTGMLSFYGDLYGKHYQAPWVSRVGYDLNVSHRLNRYLQINFNVLFGKLGAYENTPTRHENFQSEIRAGGVNLLYDFGNFIPDQYRIRPWISAGVTSFEFLSKTDLKDKNGETYYYWNDGSIKNMPEGSANSQNAKDLVRDYKYETDIRERNADGFGKYPERAFAFPLGFGAIMEISPRFDFKAGVQYYLTTTDYIDGISDKSVGNRKGTKSKDKFVYSSFSLQYDLVADRKTKMEDTLSDAYYDGVDWLAIDNMDYDKDGVKDLDDDCQGTPAGVKVNKKGCPLDDDEDGVPNYMDDENPSPKGFEVNMHGVAQTDEFWQSWYDHYFDSLGLDKTTEIIGNAFDFASNKPKTNTATNASSNEQRVYTIELARYAAGVPSDEMAFLLSIGDIKSTILDDGSTVVYTAGTYEDVKLAKQRRDEFRAEGNKQSQVGYFKNEKYFGMTEDELEKLIGSQSANTNTAVATGTDAAVNTNTATITDNNAFAKGGIVYRVQLGAYKNRISLKAFNNSANVVELKTEEGTYRYVTAGHKTVAEAAAKKADLYLLGYTDAFVTAYKDGKRIPMNEAGATVETKEKEDLNENKTFSSIDKSLINFKIQIGSLVRPNKVADMDDRTKGLEGIGKQTTATGQVRYTIGKYAGYDEAEKARKQLEDKGFPEAFIIATFKEEIISLQEAMELLK